MIRELFAATAALCILACVRPASANPTYGTANGSVGIQPIVDATKNYFVVQAFGESNTSQGGFQAEITGSNPPKWTLFIQGGADVTVDYAFGPLTDIVPPGRTVSTQTFELQSSGGTVSENLTESDSSYCWLSGFFAGDLNSGSAGVYYNDPTGDFDSDWIFIAGGDALTVTATCLVWPFTGIQVDSPDTSVSSASALCEQGEPYHCFNLPDASHNLCTLNGIANLAVGAVWARGSLFGPTNELVEFGGTGTSGLSSCLFFSP
jgi:hypothetical protein